MHNSLWLLSYTRPYTRLILCTWLLSVVIILLQSASIWVSVECIQNVLLDQPVSPSGSNPLFQMLDQLTQALLADKTPFETLVTGTFFLSFSLFSIAGIRYLKLFIFTHINENVLAAIRSTLFKHISLMDLLFTQTIKTGEIQSLLFHDVDNLGKAIIDSLDRLFLQPLRVIFFTTLLFLLSPRITFLLYGLLSTSWILTHFFGHYLEKKSNTLMEITATLHGNATEYLSTAVLARTFSREQHEQKRWQQKSLDLARARIRYLALDYLFPLLTTIYKVGALLLTIFVGGHQVYVDHSLTGTALAKILLLIPMLLYPMEALATLYGSIRTSVASIKRIRKVLDRATVLPSPSDTPLNRPAEPLFPIVFQQVGKTFEDRIILDDISLSINQGETVLIYGPSGSGKSTLLSLLAGLSRADKGTILLGQHDLADIDPAFWWNRLGIVLQDSLFFNTTIRENLLYGAPDCSDEDLRALLHMLFPDDAPFQQDTILDLPIGNLGKKLSGGERRRLSIARALARKPDLLLLDEPTAELDTENRQIITTILQELGQSMTLVIAGHDDHLRILAHTIYSIRHSTVVLESHHDHG